MFYLADWFSVSLRPSASSAPLRWVHALSPKRLPQPLQVHRPTPERLPRREIAHQHFGGCKQHRIDLVEVVLVLLEDLRERAAVVARCAGGKRGGEPLRIAVGAVDEQCDLTAEQDRIVG